MERQEIRYPLEPAEELELYKCFRELRERAKTWEIDEHKIPAQHQQQRLKQRCEHALTIEEMEIREILFLINMIQWESARAEIKDIGEFEKINENRQIENEQAENKKVENEQGENGQVANEIVGNEQVENEIVRNEQIGNGHVRIVEDADFVRIAQQSTEQILLNYLLEETLNFNPNAKEMLFDMVQRLMSSKTRFCRECETNAGKMNTRK